MRARLVRCAASADAAGGGAAGGAAAVYAGCCCGRCGARRARMLGRVRCAPGADGARCAASADVAGDVAAGGAVRCMPGAATGGAVYAGRGWCATGSGRLEKLRVKEAMMRGALPHGGGGRRFAFGGRFECPCVAAFAPAAAWVRICSGSAARKRFERDTRNATCCTPQHPTPGRALRTSRQEVRRARGPSELYSESPVPSPNLRFGEGTPRERGTGCTLPAGGLPR